MHRSDDGELRFFFILAVWRESDKLMKLFSFWCILDGFCVSVNLSRWKKKRIVAFLHIEICEFFFFFTEHELEFFANSFYRVFSVFNFSKAKQSLIFQSKTFSTEKKKKNI